MVGVIVFGAAALLVLGLVAWAGHRMLSAERDEGTASMADGLGNFIDVFDPARARADRDLQSQKHSGTVTRTPDDDPPISVDLDAGRAVVRRPPPPAAD